MAALFQSLLKCLIALGQETCDLATRVCAILHRRGSWGAVRDRCSQYIRIMTDRRQALHDLVEETREEDLPLLRELVGRFQRPLEFPVQAVGSPVSEAGVVSTRSSDETNMEQRRQDLVLEAHMQARMSHLNEAHIAKVAKRLDLDPRWIAVAGGGASIGEGDAVEISRHWFDGTAFIRLNTFYLEQQQIITFEKAEISNAGPDVIYKVRVLTPNADAEAQLNLSI
jgi:hypothetical protein